MRAINEINDPRLVKALAHPLRVSILSALENRTASPSELAEELDVPLPNLSYHIRMLVQLDLLKLVRTRPRRGAIEHYYQAKGRVAVSDRAWGQVPGLVKEAMVSSALRTVGELVDAAAVRGGFEASDTHLSSQRVQVDAQGWKDISKKMRAFFEDVQKVQADSEKRRKDSDHLDEVDAGVVMMLFNAPPVDAPLGDAKKDGAGQHKRTNSRKRATA